ncbi:peptidyl-prolyl cis-trans isomerase-like [Pyxicephalus adspersus]|uniref:Peptidyl-prolyl cis-trans isomerase n=1 Tax=Pyxicephalus adspersus TaxID=30357 RepID=A0AAV2ZJB8_PYXAD|nr:TPA: hypothetical protein GDO54_005090 [Pyxicephalus adspersus]
MTLPRVFFDITIDDEPVGRIVMKLKSDIVPKTANNFLALCTGSHGFGYKGTLFYKIIPGYLCEGGDVTNNDGTGGKSIYGEKFADENFILKHNRAGILAMANSGPDTNGSVFFICTSKTDWLDGKNVVFGSVVQGIDVLLLMEKCGSSKGKPSKKVVIADCGQLLHPS